MGLRSLQLGADAADLGAPRTCTRVHRPPLTTICSRANPAGRPYCRNVHGELLERSEEIGAVTGWFHEIRASGSGRCVFVSGDAGVGKTALLRAITGQLPEGTRVLAGARGSLFTPQPRGPLLDIADAAGPAPVEALETGSTPHAIANALLRVLPRRDPAVLVIE